MEWKEVLRGSSRIRECVGVIVSHVERIKRNMGIGVYIDIKA